MNEVDREFHERDENSRPSDKKKYNKYNVSSGKYEKTNEGLFNTTLQGLIKGLSN
jgi:hypothetical protein